MAIADVVPCPSLLWPSKTSFVFVHTCSPAYVCYFTDDTNTFGYLLKSVFTNPMAPDDVRFVFCTLYERTTLGGAHSHLPQQAQCSYPSLVPRPQLPKSRQSILHLEPGL